MKNDVERLIDLLSDSDADVGTINALAVGLDQAQISIACDDEDPDDLNNDGDALWVVSEHTLWYGEIEIARWTRCACGHYGDQGRSEMVNVWTVEEDTMGGDELPETVLAFLDAIGIEDDIPDVPEPKKATEIYAESADGEFAVYWETVGEDSKPLRRYDSLEAAIAVCDQFDREFRQSNPSGGGTTYLCGHSVRQLVDGEWIAVEDE